MDASSSENAVQKESKLSPNVAPFVPRQMIPDLKIVQHCNDPNYNNAPSYDAPTSFQSTSSLAAYPSDGHFYQECYIWHPWSSYTPVMPHPTFSMPNQAMVNQNRQPIPRLHFDTTMKIKSQTPISVSLNNSKQETRVQESEAKHSSREVTIEKVSRKTKSRKYKPLSSEKEGKEFSNVPLINFKQETRVQESGVKNSSEEVAVEKVSRKTKSRNKYKPVPSEKEDEEFSSVSLNNSKPQTLVQNSGIKNSSAEVIVDKVERRRQSQKCKPAPDNKVDEEFTSTKDRITPWPVNHSKKTKTSASLNAMKYMKSKALSKESAPEECSFPPHECQEKNVNILINAKQFEWKKVHRKNARVSELEECSNSSQECQGENVSLLENAKEFRKIDRKNVRLLSTQKNESSSQNNTLPKELAPSENLHLKSMHNDDRSENNAWLDVHEPASKMTDCGASVATGERGKKKKKSDGQRKKEYRNKIKSLPSVQGKVLTVTHEFYNLLTQNESRPSSAYTHSEEDNGIKFKSGDFPALGDGNATLSDSFTRNCPLRESERTFDQHSDSDWSDIDTNEHILPKNELAQNKSGLKWPAKDVLRINKENRDPVEDFPALGEAGKASEQKISYSELVKMGRNTHLETNNGAISASSTGPLETVTVKSQSKPKKVIFSLSAQGQPDAKPPKKPKANSLIEYNLMTMLTKKKSAAKDVNKKNLISNENKKMVKVKPVIANILDSSAPNRRRGKEREKPAKRKPTAMKKIILKEREERKLMNKVLTINSTENTQLEARVENKSESDLVGQIQEKVDKTSLKVIHSRKFREYCNQMLNPEMDDTVTKLIQDLTRFQDRLFQKDPIKARMRRRIVVGLREVTKHLKLKKLKCIILAPNLEKIKSNGGLDEVMGTIISLAKEQNIPFVFALGRKGLGRICLKKVPVSCVGIFNYEGSEVNFKHLCELAVVAQDAYNQAIGLKDGVNTSTTETASTAVEL